MSTYIFESKKIESIVDFIDSETFFIFDIDHTLIETAQVIGSTHWEKHFIRRQMDQGLSYEDASKRSFALWKQIQKSTEVRTIENGIFRLVSFLKTHNIPTLGLTSRDHDLMDLTFDQLKKVNLENVFNLDHPPHALEAELECHFSRGAVFCGDNPKDIALKALFKKNDIAPKKIIFIDDQKDHLYELEEMAYHAEIEYIEMQYTASNHERFNSDIAVIQEKHLPNILSDDEALKLMQN